MQFPHFPLLHLLNLSQNYKHVVIRHELSLWKSLELMTLFARKLLKGDRNL